MSEPLAVCTFDGIWFSGRPKPANGVLPITMTWGSSCTAAGLARAPASASPSAAEACVEATRAAIPTRALKAKDTAQRAITTASPFPGGGLSGLHPIPSEARKYHLDWTGNFSRLELGYPPSGALLLVMAMNMAFSAAGGVSPSDPGPPP